jgi:hypothetical protein
MSVAWIHRSALMVGGPAGWFPVERMDVLRGDGAAQVGVETWPTSETDLDRAVENHLDRSQLTARDWQPVELDGAEEASDAGTRRRSYSRIDSDGNEVRAELLYRRVPVGLFVVTTTWRSTVVGACAEAQLVAHSAALVSSAPKSFRLTMEEVVVAALRAGATSFPGLPHDYEASLGSDAAVVLAVAARSLSARRSEDPALDRCLELGFRPDLLATVDTLGAGVRTTTYFAARSDGAVAITADRRSGELVVSVLEPEHIAATLLAGIRDSTSQPERFEISIAELESLAGGRSGDTGRELPASLLGSTHTIRRVRTAYRSNLALAGGELQWLVSADGSAWRLEPAGGRADTPVLVDASGRTQLLAQLAQILPGHDRHTDRKGDVL